MKRTGMQRPLSRIVGIWLVLFLFLTPVEASDTVLLLEGGINEGEEDVKRYGGAVRYNFGPDWSQGGDWRLGVYLELSFTYWDGENGTTGENEFVDFGLTPVLRY